MSSYDQSPFASTVRQGRNRIIAVGIVMILAGVAAIAFPLISSLSVVWIVGVMLIVASIAQSVSAFSYPKWGGIILGLLIAALWLAGGLYLLMRPLEGIFGTDSHRCGSFSGRRYNKNAIFIADATSCRLGLGSI
ncbi:Short repeat of unknown function [Loktanella salsilacus]|uniref:Uncharacterized protein n=1 Tax=Loktanella salsilacus TaxID=195913 RepID=A0A1I4CRT1_9RHOB|nr:DUF308 domain-containing protein [Loktanella salsilacus]SFK82641.1 Short repeat of unknown function [Loktanella salsilacus]